MGQQSGSGIDPLNIAVNALSGGYIGYQDGKFGKGVQTNAIDEALGEVTGRNAARKGLMNNADAVREAKDAQQKALDDQTAQQASNDMAASSAAGAANAAARLRSASIGGTDALPSGPLTDLLGRS